MQGVRYILLLLFCFIELLSKGQHFNFTQYSIDKGLSQSQITCLLQDKYGYIVTGTNGGGIDYFDGKQFFNISTPQGLASGQIRTLYITEKETIICGLHKQFYSVIFSDTIKNFNHINKFGASSVTAITRNNEGKIFMSNEYGDIFVLDDYFNPIYQLSINKYVSDLAYDHNNVLWIAAFDGLYFLTENEELKKESFLDHITINSIYIEENNNIWVTTSRGIAINSEGIWKWCDYITENEHYTCVLPISDTEIWFGTYGNGILKWNGNKLLTLNKGNGLANLFINNIVRDHTGSLWIGTFGGGLIKYSGDQFIHYTKAENPFFEEIMSIQQDIDGNYWFGAYGEGVLQIDGKGNNKLFNKGSLLNNNIVYSVEPLSDKRVFIASRVSDLLVINPNQEKASIFKLPDGENIFGAILVKEDYKGRIWIATSSNGIYVLSDNQYYHFSENIPSKKIRTFSLSDINNIWFGTEDNGCFAIPMNQIDSIFNYKIGVEKIILNIKVINNLPVSQINAICFDKKDNMWIGTFGNGLIKIKPDGTKSIISKNKGLLSNNIYSIIITDDIVWIGTDKGVNKLLMQNDNIIEAFPGIECNINAVYLDNHGYIWFGNTKGISVFNVNQIPIHNIFYGEKLHFTEIDPPINNRKSNLPILTNTSITLPYSNNRITLSFKVVDLNNPEDIEYQYRMESLDSSWHTIRSIGQARYSFIPPGNYIFRVKATSIYNETTENEISFNIKILPPFWQTVWFYIIIFIILIIISAIFFRQRQLLLIQRNKKLQELVEEKIEELKMESIWTDFQESTIRKQAKSLAERNKELKKLSLVASNTDNSVIIMAKTGEIEWVNDGFCRMYDIPVGEAQKVYGLTIADMHGDSNSLKKVKNACEKKRTQSFIFKLITAAKKEKWIQTVLTPVINHEDDCEQLIAVETDITRIKRVEEELALHIKKSDSLLKNILPEEIAEELKSKGEATPRYYKSVSVLFADVKDFSSFCQDIMPQQLLKELHEYFNEFDEIVRTNFVEKIKTIGDAYMCAGGLPLPNKSHAFNVVLVGIQMQNAVRKINERKVLERRRSWQFRVGVHTGEIISGVIGKQKFAYDIWGDTVNVASRMESLCEEGKINISGVTYEIIKDYFDCEYRGKIEIKNRGKFDMYYVGRIKTEYSADFDGIIPNETFKQYLNSL